MGIMEGYKQTEVGVIPEDWEVKTLHDVLLKYRLGGNYPNDPIENDAPLMKMGNVGRGSFDLTKIEYISSKIKPNIEDKLEYGDILFNTRNTLELVGKVAIWRHELPVAYYNSNLLKLEFNQNKIASNFFANYFLNLDKIINLLSKLAVGTTSVSAIYTRDLLQFIFIVPPIKEQRAIASALSDVDALISSLDSLIAKKRDIKQETMQELLTGRKRLPLQSSKNIDTSKYKNTDIGITPGDWEVIHLHSICSMKSGQSITEKSISSQGKYPCYGGNGLRGYTSEYTHEGSYILIGRQGALCGNVVKACGKFFASEHALVVSTKANVDEAFLAYLLERKKLNRYSESSAQPGLSAKKILNLKFVCPSFEEQQAIASIISDMDAEITALEARRAKTLSIKQAMMQELLTGKTRLVKPGATNA